MIYLLTGLSKWIAAPVGTVSVYDDNQVFFSGNVIFEISLLFVQMRLLILGSVWLLRETCRV